MIGFEQRLTRREAMRMAVRLGVPGEAWMTTVRRAEEFLAFAYPFNPVQTLPDTPLTEAEAAELMGKTDP